MKLTEKNVDAYADRLEQDYEFFCVQMLGFQPSPKQIEMVHAIENNMHVEGIFNRQGGKSTCLASYDAWKLPFGDRDMVIYLFAPILDQTKIIAGKLRQFIKGNKLLMSYMDEFSKFHITTRGGAEFQAVSASEQSHIRGHSPTIIQIDESQDIKDFKYYEDILPSGSSTGAKVQEIGTTRGRNHFYRNTLNPQIVKVYQHWTECPFTDIDYIERMKRITPRRKFEMEYCNIFDVDFGMAFPYEQLNSTFTLEPTPDCLDEGGAKGEFFIGVDFGKHEDETVCAVIKQVLQDDGIHFYQSDLGRWDTSDYDEIMADMAENYFEVYNPENALGDKTGVGEGVMDMFPDSFGLDAQDLNNDDKTELADMFCLLLEQQKVHLWDDYTERSQFERWERVRLASGKERYHHPTGEHDDIVIAVLLALKAAVEGSASVEYEATGRVGLKVDFGQLNSVLGARVPDTVLGR